VEWPFLGHAAPCCNSSGMDGEAPMRDYLRAAGRQPGGFGSSTTPDETLPSYHRAQSIRALSITLGGHLAVSWVDQSGGGRGNGQKHHIDAQTGRECSKDPVPTPCFGCLRHQMDRRGHWRAMAAYHPLSGPSFRRCDFAHSQPRNRRCWRSHSRWRAGVIW
jgi:hypothetical protein